MTSSVWWARSAPWLRPGRQIGSGPQGAAEELPARADFAAMLEDDVDPHDIKTP